MGVYQRDYMRDEPGPGGPRGGSVGGPRHWSVLTWLLIANGVVFLMQHILLAPAVTPPGWVPGGGLSWQGLQEWRVYQLFTHMFVHGSGWHLAANLLGIFFIGRILLQFLSPKLFLIVYLGGGLTGGVLQLLFSNLIEHHDTYLVGASGCAFALLVALAALIPEQVLTLLLFFIIPIRAKMKYIAGASVVISMVFVVFGLLFGGSGDPSKVQVGHMAHLGGALFGWLFVAYLMPRLMRRQQAQAREQRWHQRFGTSAVVDAEVVDPRAVRERERLAKKREKRRKVSTEVDAILDKINDQGFQSLTEEERKILDASSDKLGR